MKIYFSGGVTSDTYQMGVVGTKFEFYKGYVSKYFEFRKLLFMSFGQYND